LRQHPLRLDGGRVVRLDLAWPGRRFALEVDHVTWHGGRIEATYDKWRDRQVRLLGWEIERVTDRDIRRRPKTTVAEVVALHAMRASGWCDERAA
jgi:very-short-patch-repair endonuclease